MKVKLILISVLVVVALTMILPAAAGAKGPGSAYVYDATLTQTNAAPVSGTCHLVLNRSGLIVRLQVFGLQPREAHTAAITGFTSGAPARLPNPATDTNKDGLISGPEAAAVVGSPLVWLEPIVVKRNGMVIFQVKFPRTALTALDPVNIMLGKCAIVVYGVMQQPSYTLPFYDPKAPAACGLITGKKAY